MVGLYFLYKVVRFSVRDQAGDAYQNALTVVDFERGLKFFTEPDLQRLVVNHPALAKILNSYSSALPGLHRLPGLALRASTLGCLTAAASSSSRPQSDGDRALSARAPRMLPG
jgi:hypothetical protein